MLSPLHQLLYLLFNLGHFSEGDNFFTITRACVGRLDFYFSIICSGGRAFFKVRLRFSLRFFSLQAFYPQFLSDLQKILQLILIKLSLI